MFAFLRSRGIAVLSLSILLACSLHATAATAQALDIGGWSIVQAASDRTFTIPSGTTIQPGQYLVLGRDADRSAFESFWGVTLGSNVLYFNSMDTGVDPVPAINGDETFELRNASSGLVDGPTPAINSGDSSQRNDPEAAPWTAIVASTAGNPGSGVEAADGIWSGLVISEASDADGSGNYVYEFVELYYDADDGGTGNLSPVITGTTHSPTSPEDGDTITIDCTATDSDGSVVSVLCHWRYEGGGFASATMSASGDDYTWSLTGALGNETLEYYITAEDDGGAIASTPAGAPSTWYSVAIEGDGPVARVILFDHSHDQDAGSNGNWRVDDNHPDPYPAVPTSETSWNGQLSTWGYELYQAGHTVRSNPSTITASTFVGVDLFVIPEPQDPFTAAEIEAVRQFVHDGGSLFMIGDHNSSDRNGNGWDSPSIFGGYSVPHITTPPTGDTETFAGALFGLHFHVKDEGNNSISGSYTNVASAPDNPVIHGDSGTVSGVYYHVGNVMTLWPTANAHLSDVGGIVSKDGGSPHMAAWSRYGDGKVFGYGDSSSMADGTGSESHENNWTEASHRELFLNATWWLLERDVEAGVDGRVPAPGLALNAWPNPFNPSVAISFTLPAAGHAQVEVYDVAGRHVRTLVDGERREGEQSVTWNGRGSDGRAMASGVYLVRAAGSGMTSFTKVVLAR